MIAIKNSNIVNLYKYVHQGPYVYLMMELCRSNLEEFLKENKDVPSSKLHDIAFGMINAVNCCHANGISHGDIKPSNFLFDFNGRIKICDFGLAQKSLHEQIYTNLSGTMMFLAPEVIQRLPFDAFAADIWSLGVSLYCVFASTYPWQYASKYELASSILLGKYDETLVNDVFFRQIIKKCLTVNPKERPTAEELLHSCNEYLNLGKKKKIFRPFSLSAGSMSLILKRNMIRPRRCSFNNEKSD